MKMPCVLWINKVYTLFVRYIVLSGNCKYFRLCLCKWLCSSSRILARVFCLHLETVKNVSVNGKTRQNGTYSIISECYQRNRGQREDIFHCVPLISLLSLLGQRVRGAAVTQSSILKQESCQHNQMNTFPTLSSLQYDVWCSIIMSLKHKRVVESVLDRVSQCLHVHILDIWMSVFTPNLQDVLSIAFWEKSLVSVCNRQ